MAAACAGAASAQSINIPTDGNNIVFWGPDAIGDQSYGQAFTAPNSKLLDYSLTVSGDAFQFVSQVYAWDGSGTTGSALFTSEVLTNPPANTTFTFKPDIALTSGQMYIALVTPDPGGVNIGGSGVGSIAANFTNGAPSEFFFAEGDPGVHNNWFSFIGNAEFHADFAAGVPEPATWAMMLFGFGGLGAAIRSRRKQAATA